MLQLFKNLGLVTKSGKIRLDTVLLVIVIGFAVWAIATKGLSWHELMEFVCSNRN